MRLSAADRSTMEDRLSEAVARVTARWATTTAEHLRHRNLTASAAMPDEWWDDGVNDAEASDALAPVLRDAALASGTAVSVGLGGRIYIGGEPLETWARKQASEASRLVVDTVRADIERRITDAEDDASAAEALTTYAADTKRPWVTAAYMVGLAVTFGGSAGAQQAAEQSDGQVATKTWELDPSHPEDDECDDNDGVTLAVDDEYGTGDPPAHWNCSCSLAYDLSAPEALAASSTPTTEGGNMSTMGETASITFGAEEVARCAAVCASAGYELDLGGLTAAADGSVTVTKGKSWHAIGLVEGWTTSDGREFAPGSIKTRNLPQPYMCLGETNSWGHEKARIAGAMTTATRDGNVIYLGGWFDTGPNGVEAEGWVEREVLRFVSVDVEVFDYEIVFDDEDDLWDMLFWQGENRRPARREPVTASGERIALTTSAGGKAVRYVTMGGAQAPQSLYGYTERYTDAALMGVTSCPFPAFPQAVICLADKPLPDPASLADPEPLAGGQASMTACAAPALPPAEWFSDPGFDRPTRVTITPEGRVFGHLARFDVPHIGHMGKKVFAPRNALTYERFNKGVVDVLGPDGPTEARTGRVVMGDDHAGRYLTLAEATQFYARACAGVANVKVGMDRFGPWVAGAIDPGATPEQVRLFRACGNISGDWRPPPADESGPLRLCGVLVVNEPGFPIDEELVASAGLSHLPNPSPTASYRGEETMALVAAGRLSRRDDVLGLVADLKRRVDGHDSLLDVLTPVVRNELSSRVAR